MNNYLLNKVGKRARLTLSACALAVLSLPTQAQTLEECQQAAERNYPLIRQYSLIERTTELTVANIKKGWLPQVTAQAQASLQSDVTAWPGEMLGMMQQLGVKMAGLKKDQYRVGVDISQTIYDGGNISLQQEIARRQGEVEAAQTESSLYGVRRRVNEMYFGLLLLDEQIEQNQSLQQLLASNEQKLASMLKHGTAAQSDYNAVKAERLRAAQTMSSLHAQRQTLARMLSVFCGIEVGRELQLPVPGGTADTGVAALAASGWEVERPELKALDAQLRLTDAKEKALDAALKPRLGLFAQGYYGYPGLNMFDDMMRHRWSLNGIVGARLTWNIGALYTRRNDKVALSTQRDMLNTQREVFLFNNGLEKTQQYEDIERYRQLMADDEEIIELRSSVRKAAESKLAHGIIDVNSLITEINNEIAARQQQKVHEIEMVKEFYELKTTINHP